MSREMSDREKNYNDLIDAEAKMRGATFYVNCGEGRELMTKEYYGEDVSGWLIPNDMKADFEAELASVPKGMVLAAVVDDKWDEWFCTAVWRIDNGKVSIDFE